MAENEEQRNWAELPSDILSLIYKKLGAIIVLWPAQDVCHSWRRVSLEPSVWRRIDLRCDLMLKLQATEAANIAREAVERSGGDVEELFIGGPCSNALLSCIVGRTTKLRCLVLFASTGITSEVLLEFIEWCPLLEELQIIEHLFSPKVYGNIGRVCPELRRFRLNAFLAVDSDNECSYVDKFGQIYNSDDEFGLNLGFDKVAFVIANNMANLRELSLIGDRMTNKGLDAILHKCLHLESLDIRHCHHVNLSESMRAKLTAINTVKLSSYDSCIPRCDFEYTECLRDYDYNFEYTECLRDYVVENSLLFLLQLEGLFSNI